MKEIWIYGPIGETGLFDEGITAKAIKDALGGVPKDELLVVRLNSPGGSVREGAAIYSLLSDRDVTVRIDGAAWSIAALIAVAGKRVQISEAASIMIHDAWGMTIGNAEDHLRNAEALDKLSDAIAQAIARRTGQEADKVRADMRKETWFTPEEAVGYGLADEIIKGGDDAEARLREQLEWAAAFHYDQFAVNAKSRLEALAGMKKEGKMNDTQTKPVGNASAGSTAQDVVAAPVRDGNAPPAQTVQQAANSDTAQQLPDIRDELKRMVAEAIRDSFGRARAPEPLAVSGSERIQVRQETLRDLLAGKSRRDRIEFLKREWNHLRQAYPLFDPVGANVDATSPAGALTPALVSDVVITVLQQALAPLQAFARRIQAGRIGRNAINVPVYSAHGTTSTNPTNFEDATAAAATITNYPVTPQHIVTYMHMTNAEMQNGWDIAWLAEGKANEFAQAVMAKITTLLTVTNFPSPYLKPYASFTASDMKALWAAVARAPQKYAILHPEYYKVVLPDNLQSFNPLSTGTLPGWDGVFVQSYWTGAGTDILGVALNPQGIVVAAGLPNELPNAANRPVVSTVTIDTLGMQVDMYTWFSPATRTIWQTIECMFGAAKGDASAVKLLKNNTT